MAEAFKIEEIEEKVILVGVSEQEGDDAEGMFTPSGKYVVKGGKNAQEVAKLLAADYHDLREAHKDDFFSVPEDNPLEDFLQTVDEAASPDSDPEQAALAFICKRLKLNLKKLSEEEKKWLKKIAQKSDLLKNPKPQRGRK